MVRETTLAGMSSDLQYTAAGTVGTPAEKLSSFRHWMGERIRGQDHVLDQLAAHFLRSEQGLTERGLPKGGWMFVGPTGVGKTEVTVQMTLYWFGEGKLARFDMSEFPERDSISEFIKRVCQALREGKRVFLWDECEKAHLDILNLLLQILSAARLTDLDGTTYDFSDAYVVLTSNLGADTAMRSRTRNMVAFENTIKIKVQQGLKKPELLGRFEETGAVLVFYPLYAEIQWQVAEVAVRKMIRRMHALGHEIELTTEAMNFVMRNGFKPDLGARPLQGLLRRQIEGAVARRAIEGEKANGRLVVSADRMRLEISDRKT